VPAQVRAELQRAAESELLHQQTRAEFGPAQAEPKPEDKKDQKKEEKPADKKKAKS
jgi:hypothetical protein